VAPNIPKKKQSNNAVEFVFRSFSISFKVCG
jgi:hypothetical protein